jgi:hypothetical protein
MNSRTSIVHETYDRFKSKFLSIKLAVEKIVKTTAKFFKTTSFSCSTKMLLTLNASNPIFLFVMQLLWDKYGFIFA